jgi:hypothetical protein
MSGLARDAFDWLKAKITPTKAATTPRSAAYDFKPVQSDEWPADWAGLPCGDEIQCGIPFPCIGMVCAPVRRGHLLGTRCQPFRDVVRYKRTKHEWQHMCLPCFDGLAARS